MTPNAIPWLTLLSGQEDGSVRTRIEHFISKARLPAPERAALRKFASALERELPKLSRPLEEAAEEVDKRLRIILPGSYLDRVNQIAVR